MRPCREDDCAWWSLFPPLKENRKSCEIRAIDFLLLFAQIIVVPAEEPGPIRRSRSIGHGVWVPAFAGTTKSRLARRQRGAHALGRHWILLQPHPGGIEKRVR